MNHSPPHTEHHSSVCSGNQSAAASAEGAQLPGLFSVRREILSSGLDIPKRSAPGWGLLPTGRGRASRPGCHPAPADLPFYSLILLKVSWARTQPAPPLYSVMGTSLPVEMLAEVEPGCARPKGGLSGKFTKEGLEKEKPLKQSPARSMLLKDIRKGAQLAVNNFLQLFFDVQGNYPLHKIRHERFLFQCLQVLSNKRSLCRNDRFHVHLYFQSWVLLVQIFQKYSFCLFLDSSEHRLLCYKL